MSGGRRQDALLLIFGSGGKTDEVKEQGPESIEDSTWNLLFIRGEEGGLCRKKKLVRSI